jgi:hypothetical protein
VDECKVSRMNLKWCPGRSEGTCHKKLDDHNQGGETELPQLWADCFRLASLLSETPHSDKTQRTNDQCIAKSGFGDCPSNMTQGSNVAQRAGSALLLKLLPHMNTIVSQRQKRAALAVKAVTPLPKGGQRTILRPVQTRVRHIGCVDGQVTSLFANDACVRVTSTGR